MKIKINKQLNEELISGIFTIIIPIKVKIDGEKVILMELNDVISKEVISEVDIKLNENLVPYIEDSKENILKQLNIDNFEISNIDVNIDEYDTVPIMSGIALFDVETNEEVDKGRVKQIFNTLINDSDLYEEFNVFIEDDVYDIFEVIVGIEKDGDIEIGSY